MADYPGAIPTFVVIGYNQFQNAPSHSALHNQQSGEIVAICSTLGTHAEGAYATVDARIAALEGSIGVNDWTRVATTLQPVNAGDNVRIDGNITNGSQNVTVLQLNGAVTNSHVAATAGTGISVTGQQVDNTDLGSAARTAHELAYNHANFMSNGLTSAYVWIGNASNVATAVALSGDLTVSNTGVVAIVNDSHNHTVSTVSLSLDNLSDVVITAPVVDHILRYTGSQWVNGPEQNVNGGSGVDFFYDTTASDIGGYEVLSRAPQNIAEQDQTAVCNNNTVLIKAFATPSAGIGGTQIDAGVWTFDIWAYADVLTLASNVQIDVYKRTSGGTETLLFTVNSPTLTGTLDIYSVLSIQQAFAINATDRIVAKVSGVTLNTSNTTIHFAFGGTTHYSHFNTPLVTRHNDLAGLQGGSGTEFYHMTQAQNTSLASIHTQNTDTGTSQNTFSVGNGAAGNKVIQANNADATKPAIRYDDTANKWQFANDGSTWTDFGTGTGSLGYTLAFTNASLSAGILTVNHALGVDYPDVAIYDNNKKWIIPDEVTSVTTNQLTVDLSSYGTISGTWNLLVMPAGVAAGTAVDTSSNQSVGGVKTFTSQIIQPSVWNTANFLYNGDFENWSSGGAAAPDGWTLFGGLSVASEGTTKKIGSYSVKLNSTSGNITDLYQQVHADRGIAYWQGRTVTFGCWVWSAYANLARLEVYDGSLVYSSYHTGNSTWQFLTVTATIGVSATVVQLGLYCTQVASQSAYFDGAIFVEGSSCPSFYSKTAEESSFADFSSWSTVVGWSSISTKLMFIRRIGKRVFVDFTISGTSNSATTTFTVPYQGAATSYFINPIRVQDNSGTATVAGFCMLQPSTSTVYLYKDGSGSNNWTTSNTKTVWGQLNFEVV